MRPRHRALLLVAALLRFPHLGCPGDRGTSIRGWLEERPQVASSPLTLRLSSSRSSSRRRACRAPSSPRRWLPANRGTTPASIAYTYVAASGGGSGSGADTLAAGEQRVIADAISYLRTRGVPASRQRQPRRNVAGRFHGTLVGLGGRRHGPDDDPRAAGGADGPRGARVCRRRAFPAPHRDLVPLRSSRRTDATGRTWRSRTPGTRASGPADVLRATARPTISVDDTLPPGGFKQFGS